jgi:hypothetical protein
VGPPESRFFVKAAFFHWSQAKPGPKWGFLLSRNASFLLALFLFHCSSGNCGELATKGVFLGGFLCETLSGLVQ